MQKITGQKKYKLRFFECLFHSFNRTIDGENPGQDIRLQGELFVMVGTSNNRLTNSSQPQLPTHMGGGVANPFVTARSMDIYSLASTGPPLTRSMLNQVHGIMIFFVLYFCIM